MPIDRSLLLASFRVCLVSAGWTVASATAAVVIGLTAPSTVAVALGAVGFVDAIGSTALAFHFRHGLRHERFSPRREQAAHVAVSFGLLVVGLASVAGGAYRLAAGKGSDPSIAFAVLAGSSVLALSFLAARKIALGPRVGSRTLVGDGHLSLIGALQATIALGGLAAAEWLAVDWADAVSTIAVGALAAAVGAVTWRAGSTTD